MASDETVIKGRILKWGNSYGVRIRKADLERAGLSPGSEAILRLGREGDRVDLSDLPTFRGGDPEASRRHDEYLGQARKKTLAEREG